MISDCKAIEQADDRKVARPRAQPSTPDERSEAIHSLARRVVLLGLRWIEEAVRGLEPMTNYLEFPDSCEGTAKPCTAPEFHPSARSWSAG